MGARGGLIRGLPAVAVALAAAILLSGVLATQAARDREEHSRTTESLRNVVEVRGVLGRAVANAQALLDEAADAASMERFTPVARSLQAGTGFPAGVTGLGLTSVDRPTTAVDALPTATALDTALGLAAAELPQLAARARDSGESAATSELPRDGGLGTILLVAPVYGGTPFSPGQTAVRRASLTGYVVAEFDPVHALEGAGTDMSGIALSLGASAAPGDETLPIDVVGRQWTVATDVPGTGMWDGTWTLGLSIVTAAALLVFAAWSRRAMEQADATIAESEHHARLVAEVGSLLQSSLELGEVLPAVVLRLADELDLDAAAMAVATEGQLVESFSYGREIAFPVRAADLPRAPRSAAAGDDVLLPLHRAGRTIGVLAFRPRKDVSAGRMASIAVVGDLLAAGVTNAQLFRREQEAVQRLIDLDQSKTEFIGTVSHELRTPLTAILGFGRMLDTSWETLSEEQRRDFSSRITRNASNLAALMNQVLDFSRLERGVLRVQPEDVDLSKAVVSILEQGASLVEDHLVETEIDDGIVAHVDVDSVDRIVSNLLTNAAKFSPKHTRVVIALHAEDGVGPGRAVLTVDDEGPGIPPDERRKVFDRFYRGAGEAVLRSRGAGIGLAVARELAERMGGGIDAIDSPLGGARIVVVLPLAAPQAEGSEQEPAGDDEALEVVVAPAVGGQS